MLELKRLVVAKKRFERENQGGAGEDDDYIDTIKEASSIQNLAQVVMTNLI
jgi:hypothetical protein